MEGRGGLLNGLAMWRVSVLMGNIAALTLVGSIPDALGRDVVVIIGISGLIFAVEPS